MTSIEPTGMPKAFIHVNMVQMRRGEPAICVRIHQPQSDGSTEEIEVHRCRSLAWDGPSDMRQDDEHRLDAGARIWIEVYADQIEYMDGEPWTVTGE